MTHRPEVLFVCRSNRGKSQMAEALLRRRAGDRVRVSSAGTDPAPGATMNEESVASLAEAGADMASGTPKGIDPEVLLRADRIVVLGRQATVEPVEGMRGTIETWDTDEPSLRGIHGMERMRLLRDDIDLRVRRLLEELTGPGADG
jgi:arsenate-mycothiol transferase